MNELERILEFINQELAGLDSDEYKETLVDLCNELKQLIDAQKD